MLVLRQLDVVIVVNLCLGLGQFVEVLLLHVVQLVSFFLVQGKEALALLPELKLELS